MAIRAIRASPVNLSSAIVFLKYVFTRFKVEKLLSLVAVVIGSVAKICSILNMAGIKSLLHSAKAQTAVQVSAGPLIFLSAQIHCQISIVLGSQQGRMTTTALKISKQFAIDLNLKAFLHHYFEEDFAV